MFYSIIKKCLFCLDPEKAHSVSLFILQKLEKFKIISLLSNTVSNPKKIMGLIFRNPIGLAAGFDKNGDYIDGLAALGFGFIEIGSITPRPQPGNLKPRLFRLVNEKAIINRMGFNNKGVDYLISKLKNTKYKGVLGINIGKNLSTSLDRAVNDYVLVLKKVMPFATYVTINISSPNTKGLRDLQSECYLRNMLQSLKKEQHEFNKNNNKYVPLLVKISPDLSDSEIQQMANVFLAEKIDGLIATNTTISRVEVKTSIHASEMGGMSGKPLFNSSMNIVKKFSKLLKNEIPIIACGGISSASDAKKMIDSGASLVQIYTGLLYNGPKIINELAKI
ncbi:quinone-dependent dihydroorotate dehydrogenase [Gammaproteobacteria bacterium]|nr:quinone-dependent dihydroorotate dehydrogenase [Gammaproteobacteria bacterium]